MPKRNLDYIKHVREEVRIKERTIKEAKQYNKQSKDLHK
jgi:hypothetical protein